MRYLCVAAVVGLLAIDFSSATPDLEAVEALVSEGCSHEQAILILKIKPQPLVPEVKGWLEYFHSDLGGNISSLPACDKAWRVFNGTYFNGPRLDLFIFMKWVDIFAKRSAPMKIPYLLANRHARTALSKPHPALGDVEPLVSAGCRVGEAFKILNIAPQPPLGEVQIWLDYFASEIGGSFRGARACRRAKEVLNGSNFGGPHKDLATFKTWVEYFSSEMGGAPQPNLPNTSESANMDTVKVLSSPHPHLAVLKTWVTYFAAQDGGNLVTYELANHEALRMLGAPHPCLEDLQPWAKFYMGSQGGRLVPGAAVTKAEQILRKKHPDLEDLKETAEHFFAPEGGDFSHSSSLDKAWEVLIPHAKEPVLSDAKVCYGEGDAAGSRMCLGIILLVMFKGCIALGVVALIGAAIYYKGTRQEGVRARLRLPFVTVNPAPSSDPQVQMNVHTAPTASSFLNPPTEPHEPSKSFSRGECMRY